MPQYNKTTNKKYDLRILSIFFIFVLLPGLLMKVASAQVMSSTNYKMQADSVNVGGLDTGSSANYKIYDTVGEVSTGYGSSTNYNLHAGYRQLLNSSISITVSNEPDVLLQNLSILTDSAIASTTWTVITDNVSGYTLAINAATNNALIDTSTSESFENFATSSPAIWNVTDSFTFGFSVLGSHADAKYSSGGEVACGASNVPNPSILWQGFTTSLNQIASSNIATVLGTGTTVCFATEQNGVFAPSGTYTATITATAVAQ